MNRKLSDLTVGDILTIVIVLGALAAALFVVALPARERAHHVRAYTQCVESGRLNCH